MPKILGPIPTDRWEREVLHQFRQQLPKEWVVVSSVCWTLETEAGFVRDGQADFVILVPGSGMVVAEVKGSREFRVADDGRWYRRERSGAEMPINESPPAQATRNMHELSRVVVKQGGWGKFPGRFAYIVIYPNGRASQLPAMFDRSTLATSQHMHELASCLRLTLEQRGSSKEGETFSNDVVEKIGKILTCRQFAITKADTQSDVEDDVVKVDELTRQQFSALRGVFDLPRVAVVGPAGSGKTLLAIWRLQALLEAGSRALYVCFNKNLAELLRRKNPDHASAIVNVDRFFRKLCRVGQISDTDKYFREELPGQAMNVASELPVEEKYDAIIVDEGQDFSELQLIALYEFLKPTDASWVFFGDWCQDLFQVGSGVAVGAEVMFRLYHNCRNTVCINGATNTYMDQRVEPMPGLPEGEQPLVEVASSQVAMANRAWELAKQWAPDGGVVILSPYRLENSAMAQSRRGHGLALSEDLSALGEAGMVYFSTIRAFKGIEAAVVIVVDAEVPDASPVFMQEDLYVACTRATTRLALITKSVQMREWLSQRR
ncbi:MAG: NERD domain-containing protein [Planctomycetales bacterium]|nr:NERD domain-containing protein [Planctomycetales bacterium]